MERAEKDSGRLRDALNAQARELAELESLATRTHEHAVPSPLPSYQMLQGEEV